MLSVVPGRVIVCGPLQRWGASRLFRRGIRLQAVAASCAHARVSESRARSQWDERKCSCQEIDFSGCLFDKRAKSNRRSGP